MSLVESGLRDRPNLATPPFSLNPADRHNCYVRHTRLTACRPEEWRRPGAARPLRGVGFVLGCNPTPLRGIESEPDSALEPPGGAPRRRTVLSAPPYQRMFRTACGTFRGPRVRPTGLRPGLLAEQPRSWPLRRPRPKPGRGPRPPPAPRGRVPPREGECRPCSRTRDRAAPRTVARSDRFAPPGWKSPRSFHRQTRRPNTRPGTGGSAAHIALAGPGRSPRQVEAPRPPAPAGFAAPARSATPQVCPSGQGESVLPPRRPEQG